ncbi:hypothetical protein SAMN05660662_0343 [Blastococcus aurantiacus]|uniref:Uncharacterized protein n=1 Tax=Blastococcus aurantiacus TaxID=1550231 RepID=A0A1G7RH87_9ACTN|nr:hypothetical protein [Blastococcus aurantiacus]SDG10196.1 hypothetical protein SAMN05660662_0343 [Blastococcus aurantiacus]
MTPPSPHDGDALHDLGRFLADLRRTGTVVTGPVDGRPGGEEHDDEPGPVEWLVTAHRGTPTGPPYRLMLDEQEFSRAVERDARVIESWWPAGDARARAYTALLLSFDAALVGVDRTPHGFVLERGDHLHLTTHHLCPDPIPHLDPDGQVANEGSYGWFAYEPGSPEFDEELAEQQRRSRHRRHSYLVLGYLEVEAAHENGQRMDATMGYLQDALGDAFGNEVFQRFSAYVEATGSPSTVALSEIMHAEDERFDAFLDALAGEGP